MKFIEVHLRVLGIESMPVLSAAPGVFALFKILQLNDQHVLGAASMHIMQCSLLAHMSLNIS